jgi:uncharacterized FlgJ-related protein
MRSYLLIIFISIIFQIGSVVIESEKPKEIHYQNVIVKKTNDDDSLNTEYKNYLSGADSILKDYNTILTGEIFTESWSKTKEQYGIDVPLSLALAQAKIESGFCTSKLSMKKNNPFSIKGRNGYVSYSTISDGVDAYYKIIATRYLNCRSLKQLLNNFINCNGHRYAGDTNYENSLKREIKIIEEKIK